METFIKEATDIGNNQFSEPKEDNQFSKPQETKPFSEPSENS